MKLRTLLLISFLLFPAFHADASITVDKNVVRDTTEQFCVTNNDNANAVIAYPTTGAYQYGFSIEGSGTYCSDLYSLWDLFQSGDPYGEGVRIVVGDTNTNPSFLDDCITAGTYDACILSSGVQFTGRILSLRQANSILGAQSGGEYVAAVAENTGVTIDDFYPVAAAALGLLLAFVVLGYIMGLFKDDTPELLEKTKRLSREVDEHIEKTTESYKAWNRRLPDLFR